MIRKRNLDPSLVQWIMTQTGLGPGIGEFHWVAPASSATSQYRTQLQRWGVEQNYKIHTKPSLAYDAAVAYRNDVVLVLPGTYTETETLSWAKANTHMLGVGNPSWRHLGAIQITSTVEAATATVDVTAAHVFFGGLSIKQNGAYSACVTALRLSSTYFRGKELDVMGHLNSEVAGVEGASSLEFADGTSYGFGSTFDDCAFGTGSGANRTASSTTTNGVINFAVDSQSGSPAGYTEFHNCRILSRAQSTGTAMIRFADARWGADRYVWWDHCLFFNFWNADELLGCFYFKAGARGGNRQILTACTLRGADQWETQNTYNVFMSMPITAAGGGLTLEASGTAGN